MATSWMIVDEDGQRNPVDLRTSTRQGVLAAVRRAKKAGQDVLAAYQGGPRAIALCPRVYPRPA
ncbi:MAG: hypothetical protein ABIP48_18040 [Planctomycetota bacterium]